ncbi:MAG: hypothetical protein E7632_01355 [Ruminococcaceae bacterium]|nr:hypothetical protein [Oscillospiraceae bacterium]
MKKSTALILAALLLMSVSCGESGTPDAVTDETTTAAPVETDYYDLLGKKNFEGAVYTILDANDYVDVAINMPGEEMNGDIINDELFMRDAKIEELYNMVIEYVQFSDATAGTDQLRSSVLAGEEAFNLCFSSISGGRLSTLSTDGILANLCEIPHLKLDAAWWSRLMYENFQLAGKMYITAGDISPALYQAPTCVYLNKKLLEEYQIDTDFYTLVNEGKWTVDELIVITKDKDQDLNQDGKMHMNYDFYGLAYQNIPLASSTMLVGCGVELCENDGENLTINLVTERTANVVEKLQALTDRINYADMNDIYKKAFINDRALAMIHSVGTAQSHLRDMKSDFLMLPMPKYDEAQKEYRSLMNAWSQCFAAIPMNADPEFSGFITEALAYESYTNLRPQVYDLVYKQKAARDEGSAQMLDVIFNSVYIDFMPAYGFGMTEALRGIVFDEKPLASTVESYIQTGNQRVADFMKAWKGE